MAEIIKDFDGNDMFDDDSIPQEALDMAAKMIGPGQHAPEVILPDEEFEFECQQCGACCIGRSDIILNPFDIYTASKYLNIPCHEFVNKYTDRSLGNDSKIPMVTLKPNKDNNFCPFLVFDYMDDGKFKCSINDAKPGACRTHPLGIMSQCDIRNDGDVTSIKTHIIKVDQCEQSLTGKTQTVREWMKYYYDHEAESIEAHKVAIMSNSIINWRRLFFVATILSLASERNGVKLKNEMITQGFNILAGILIQFGYTDYDTDKPFIDQCKKNYKFLKDRFNSVARTLIPAMESMFEVTCKMSVDEAMEIAEKEGYDETITKISSERCSYKGVSMEDVMKKFGGNFNNG